MDLNDIYELLDSFARVAGWIVLFAGALGGLRALYLWSTYPRISLAFRPDLTFHKRRIISTIGIVGGMSMWIHVHASAKAQQTLMDCRAYLETVMQKNNSGEWVRLSEFNTKLPLQWAHTGGRERAEILPGEVAGIDIGAVEQGKPEFLIATTQPLPTGTAKVLGPGEYLLAVTCLASNAKVGRITILVGVKAGSFEPRVEVFSSDS